MKLIYLNSWQGNILSGLMKFVKDQSSNTDIFCFQEVSPPLFKKLSKALPDYLGQYSLGGEFYPKKVWYGLAVFSKKGIEISAPEKNPIFKENPQKIGFIQTFDLKYGSFEITLGNLHGMPHPGTKLDTSERHLQSKKILSALKKKKHPKIFGGDFNLLPDTQSIKMLEKGGYRNLIKEFKVKNTRNRLSWEVCGKEKNFVKQYFADYVFVSPEIKVKSFSVPYIEISDHLPMLLEVDI